MMFSGQTGDTTLVCDPAACHPELERDQKLTGTKLYGGQKWGRLPVPVTSATLHNAGIFIAKVCIWPICLQITNTPRTKF